MKISLFNSSARVVYARAMRLLLLCALFLVALAHPASAEDGVQRFAELKTCPLASGQVIQECRIGYRTFGTLNAHKDNAVIMPSWLNGRTEDLVAFFGPAPAPQRVVDTSKFYGIAFDALGDGVSSSPSNSTSQHGPAFPVFTMEDMVCAQYRVLTEVMGLKHLHAAIGFSMGAEQVFAWAALYPSFVDKAVPVVGTPQVTSFDLLSKQIVIDAIASDPEYHAGNYTVEPPLKLANEIGAQMVSAPQYRNAQWQRDRFAEWIKELQAPQRQDANDRVWQARAVMRHDVLHGRSIADSARASSPIRFLIIVAAEDRMVTPQPALEWAKAIHAETYISPATCAHLIMNCDAQAVASRILNFLDTP